MTSSTTTLRTTTTLPRWTWMAGATALIAATGIASALVFRSPQAEAEAMPSTPAPNTVTSVTPAHRSAPAAADAKLAAASPTCANCGKVESVRAVQRKGAATGVGAVAGGVLGGVVGHQMGGGSGKTAMTVLGALGGGLAGNEVEKRSRGDTVYQVQVRMDDGSSRTLTLAAATVAAGERVTVEGQTLRPVRAGS